MAYELREGEGTLWPNKNKNGESSPNLTGQTKLDGKEYWVSGWVNTSQASGAKWIKFTLRAKDESGAATHPAESAAVEDEDIPF